MSDLSATASSTAPQVGSRGAVIVGDYLGAPAAQAARAVRRVGLRPGLDRQFGCDPETIGLVVAQEPHPGGEAQRGAMVTLYVSAHGASLQGHEDPDGPAPGGDESPAPAPSVSRAAESASEPSPRRKRRVRPHVQVIQEPEPRLIGSERQRRTLDPEPADPAT
jgi:hypothetical protein